MIYMGITYLPILFQGFRSLVCLWAPLPKAPRVATLLCWNSNGAYELTPYDPAFERKMKKATNIIQRYRNTLHALSK